MLALLDTTVEYSYRLANYIQRLVFNFSDIESNKDFNQAQLNNYQAFLTYNIYENYSFIKCVCEIYDGVFAGVLCLHYIRLNCIVDFIIRAVVNKGNNMNVIMCYMLTNQDRSLFNKLLFSYLFLVDHKYNEFDAMLIVPLIFVELLTFSNL